MFFANKNYENNALNPYLSTETLDYHFGKHHVGYAENLNNLIKNTDLEFLTLEEIMLRKDSIDKKIYNNAAQVFNHDFYWKSLSQTKKAPSGKFLSSIEKNFGTFANFCNEYVNIASQMFGSGWSWLIEDSEHNLSFFNTSNADSPIIFDINPILVIDLWEHAYYIDYRNNRKGYIETLVNNCLDFEFAESNLMK